MMARLFRRFRLKELFIILFGLMLVAPSIAQAPVEAEEDEQTRFVRFLENQLSGEGFSIFISNIDGALTSEASIRLIEISDAEGVWLRIENATINWNRLALFARRLDVNTLSADAIEVLRQPIPRETVDVPSPEASAFELPDLPVAIILQELAVPRVSFGEGVFGQASEVSIEGNFTLRDGALDTTLDIQRLDGPGGSLALDAQFADGQLDLDLTLEEPEGGIVATLMGLEGQPPVTLSVNGSGPVEALDVNVIFAVAEEEILTGGAELRARDGGLGVNASLGGPIASILPPELSGFFGNETSLETSFVVRDEGGLTIERVALEGGAIRLNGYGNTTNDGFLRQLSLIGSIEDRTGARVILPSASGETSIARASFELSYGLDSERNEWNSLLIVEEFEGQNLAIRNIDIGAGGVTFDIENPRERAITFSVLGDIEGITADDPALAEAIGPALALDISGSWGASENFTVREATIQGRDLGVSVAGEIVDLIFTGNFNVEARDIAAFSGLAGRNLSGSVDLGARGSIAPLQGGFSLQLLGEATNLGLSIPALDGLISGEAALSGRVIRDENGLMAERFVIETPEARVYADGRFSSTEADFTFEARLNDLSTITDRATGGLSIQGNAQGEDGRIALSLNADLPSGTLSGQNMRDGNFTFAGLLSEGTLSGRVEGVGFLSGNRVELGADIESADEGFSLSDLLFETRGARLSGNLSSDADGLLTGGFDLAAPDVSTAAALFLIEAQGALEATVRLAPQDGAQSAQIAANARGLRLDDVRITSAEVEADVADLFGVPKVRGDLRAQGVEAGGVNLQTLSMVARTEGNDTAFRAETRLTNGTTAALSGLLSDIGTGFRVSLREFIAAQNGVNVRLLQPSEFQIEGERITLSETVLDVAGGEIRARGVIDEGFDVSLAIRALPLSVGNIVDASLGLSGTLSGTVEVRGPRDNPSAAFNLSGTSISAAALRDAGVSALGINARGTFADNQIRLEAASLEGADGIGFTASGTVPLVGRGLNLRLDGSVPLGLANPILAERGARASGTINVSGTVTGSLAEPQSNVSLSMTGGTFVDAQTNLQLRDIALNAGVNGQSVTISALSANLAGGGNISSSGSISLDAGAGFPANLAIVLDRARYADGNLLVATLSGNLQLSGPVTGDALLSGTINVERAEITVPEATGGAAQLLDVNHRAPSTPVAQTLARARADELRREGRMGQEGGLRLDLTINAPNQIFVRGRGLDAELGGATRILGTVNDVQPTGSFSLIRGRLSILGQRITFTEGEVTLTGDLDPFINLVATTQGQGILVIVTVSGRVSDIDVSFSSQPELPQDEVLSRLIFNRGIDQLSPLQIARLAAAAAELAGGGNSSLLNSLRSATGLDDLDIVTDSEGNTGVRAGRYIQENIYLGVEADSRGQTRGTINLDITDEITARGAVGSDGASSIGVFFERDY